MIRKSVFWVLFFMLMLPVTAVGKGRSGLILNAEGLREMFTSMGGNYDLYDVPFGEDRPTISDFYLFYGQNRYSLSLQGEAGRMVTLFAEPDFGRGKGFLVLRKKDGRDVWLPDLMAYPAETWHSVSAQDGYGAFELFYHAAPHFDQNITSVKWGKWWEGDKPGS